MPDIITNFNGSTGFSWWFYFTSHGRRTRKIYVPLPDLRRVLEIPLPRPMNVNEVESWVRRDNSNFLNHAVDGFSGTRSYNRTLEPTCASCSSIVQTMARCSRIGNRYTCNDCRGNTCSNCETHTCNGWLQYHPEQADLVRRNEDPLSW